MAAKITGVELASRSLGGSGLPRSSAEGAPQAADASVVSREVSITGAATQLAALEQALGAQPAVDSSRVSALQAALANGQYSIEPRNIASGLISAERALYGLGVAGA